MSSGNIGVIYRLYTDKILKLFVARIIYCISVTSSSFISEEAKVYEWTISATVFKHNLLNLCFSSSAKVTKLCKNWLDCKTGVGFLK